MRFLLLLSGLTGMLLAANLRLAAQDIDSIVTSASRSSATIADGIKDPGERSAFISIAKTTDPQKLLALTRSFLERYPRSAFLAQAAEGAARSSFDLGDLRSGMDYARFSLSLLPENPLLLVATAEKPAQRVLPSLDAVLPLIGKRQTLLLAACAERSIIPKSRQDFRRARIAGRQFR